MAGRTHEPHPLRIGPDVCPRCVIAARNALAAAAEIIEVHERWI
jgi:hypothetical protein